MKLFLCVIFACIYEVISFSALSIASSEYRTAIAKIDTCSTEGIPSEDLYDAVRSIDRSALKLYQTRRQKRNCGIEHMDLGNLYLPQVVGKILPSRVFQSLRLQCWTRKISEMELG